MTYDEKAVVSGYLQREIDWCEHEAKRIEYGDNFAATNGHLSIAHGHIRTANMLRNLLGKLQ